MQFTFSPGCQSTDLKPQIVSAVRGLVLCVVAGSVCAFLNTPLPWMIGPMLAMATCRLSGISVDAPPAGRQTGQLVIGCTLGLYFAPPVLAVLISHAGLILFAAALAVALGYVCGLFLARVSGIDSTTALFAAMPGGSAEMSILAERYGGRPDKVAFAQSTRILLVVVIVPTVLTLSGAHGVDQYHPATRLVSYPGLLALLLFCALGALGLTALKVPNAWMLGSLFVSIAITVSGINLSAMPITLSNTGQLLLGCALGARFEPDFVHGVMRYVLGVLSSTALALVLFALVGVALSYWSGIPLPTLILASAPGGIGEMGITAKVLQLGVPLVTAFHVTRLVFLMTTVVPFFRVTGRIAAEPQKG